MAEHPFDEIAVIDAAKAVVDYDRPDDPLGQAISALTAACNSMRERGLSRAGISVEQDGRWFTNDAAFGLNSLTGMFETTIIRHKEQP